MKTRNGFHSERSRDKSFQEIMADEKYLAKSKREVLQQLQTGPMTLQEISIATGTKEHLVAARLNDLRKDELVKDMNQKKLNPSTGKSNTLWSINWEFFKPEQLEFF